MFTLEKFDQPCTLLSFQEERDLAWCTANPDICFNVCRPLLLEGPLDADVLERAINSVVAVHDGLRTRFILRDGILHRSVEPAAHFRLEAHDARNADLENADVQRAIHEFMHARFPIDAFPPFRVLLVRLAGDRSLVVLAMAHVIADASSAYVFMNDLARAYTLLASGQGEHLPEPAYTLSDFAASHRAWMCTEDYSTRLAALRDRLIPALATVASHTEDCGTAQQKARPATVLETQFSQDDYLALHEVAKLNKVSFAVALQAIGILALARLYGRRRFFISFMFSNRHLAGMGGLIGHLANALPQFVDLETPRTVREFIATANKDIFQLSSGFGSVPLGAVNHAVAGLDPMLSVKSPFNAAMVNILAPSALADFADLKVLRHVLHYGGHISNDVQLNFLDSGSQLLLLCRIPVDDPKGIGAGARDAIRAALAFAVSAEDRPLAQW